MCGKKSWQLLYWVIPSIALVVGLLVAFPPEWEWLGVGKNQETSQVTTETIDPQSKQKTVTTTKHEQAKNLWDWFSLLGVPISVAFLGWWLQYLQQKRTEEQKAVEQQRAEEQAKLEKEIAETNRREEALQAYLDRISSLLLDKNLLALADPSRYTRLVLDPRIEKQEKELLNAGVDIIRAITLSTLRQLGDDPIRKTSVLQFLLETEIIKKLNLNLSGANLEGIILFKADLTGAKFNDAKFNGADLAGAILTGADFSFADLTGVSFYGAKVEGINFTATNLTDAFLYDLDLSGISLYGANLIGANLTDANLTDADLTGAILLKANLTGADLTGANFLGSNITDVKNQHIDQFKQAKNWQKAHYDPDFRKELGLPPKEPKQN
jgi:uncharacterized protein YjbI with pentapeptide repeats